MIIVVVIVVITVLVIMGTKVFPPCFFLRFHIFMGSLDVILLQVSCCGCPPPAAISALTGEGRVRQGLVVSSEPSLAPGALWIEEKEEKKEKKGAAAHGHQVQPADRP